MSGRYDDVEVVSATVGPERAEETAAELGTLRREQRGGEV